MEFKWLTSVFSSDQEEVLVKLENFKGLTHLQVRHMIMELFGPNGDIIFEITRMLVVQHAIGLKKVGVIDDKDIKELYNFMMKCLIGDKNPKNGEKRAKFSWAQAAQAYPEAMKKAVAKISNKVEIGVEELVYPDKYFTFPIGSIFGQNAMMIQWAWEQKKIEAINRQIGKKYTNEQQEVLREKSARQALISMRQNAKDVEKMQNITEIQEIMKVLDSYKADQAVIEYFKKVQRGAVPLKK
jgi:hypothetical protein